MIYGSKKKGSAKLFKGRMRKEQMAKDREIQIGERNKGEYILRERREKIMKSYEEQIET